MATFTLSKTELSRLSKALYYANRDINETIRIYSTVDIDDFILGDPGERTYREEIEHLKSEIEENNKLSNSIDKAIFDLTNGLN